MSWNRMKSAHCQTLMSELEYQRARSNGRVRFILLAVVAAVLVGCWAVMELAR